MVLLSYCIVFVQNNISAGIVFSALNCIIQHSSKCLYYLQTHFNFIVSKMQLRYRWFKKNIISSEQIFQQSGSILDCSIKNGLYHTDKAERIHGFKSCQLVAEMRLKL